MIRRGGDEGGALRADAAPSGRRIGPPVAFATVLTLGFLLSLWLRTGFPAFVIAGAVHDDRLFVELGRHLVVGEWLGPFDNATLVKGMGYPAFVALCFMIGVPLKIGESLVYLGSATLLALLVRRITRSDMVAAVLFVALAFNPLLWSNDLARIIREGLYIGLVVAAIGLTMAIAFPAPGRRGPVAIGAGIVWGWFMLTREEGIWLLPSIAIIVGSGLFAAVRWPVRTGQRAWPAIVGKVALAGIVALTMVGSVAAMNRFHYGTFTIVEVTSRPFERAYGALSRVTPAQWRRYVVFPRDVRQKVYAVSPAARELAPVFEGDAGERWRVIGCGQTQTPVCPEILSGWFQWAFRDAVAAAGHYRSAASAAAYYDRLADEVDAACDTGRLACGPSRATLAPPFRAAYLADTAARVPALLALYWQSGLHVDPTLFSLSDTGLDGDDASVREVAEFVGNAQPTAAEATTTKGASWQRGHVVRAIAKVISNIYAAEMVLLIGVSLIGCVVLAVGIRSVDDMAVLALVGAAWTGVIARIVLLCYLDATAIPSVNMLYFSPASPLLIIGAVVGSLAGARRAIGLWRHRD